MFWKSPYLLLVIATFFWGGNFVIGRAVSDQIPPYTLSFLRWLLALCILFPFTWKKMIAEYHAWKRELPIIIILSLTGIIGFNTLLYVALQYTTSINASFMNSSTPILISVLSVWLLREGLERQQVIGTVLSFAGVLFIVSKGDLHTLQSLSFNLGDIIMILAVLTWALYSVLMKKHGPRLPGGSTFVLSILIGVMMLFPLSFWELHYTHSSIQWTAYSISAILYVGVLASLVAFYSWNSAVLRIGPAKAANYLNLIPVFAATFAILFINEEMAWYQLVGGASVIIGVAMSTKRKKQISTSKHPNKKAI